MSHSPRKLVLFWNELSFPNATCIEHQRETCAERARTAFDAFMAACKVHPSARLSFVRGTVQTEHFGRTMLSWLEQWLGRDRVTLIKTRAVLTDSPNSALVCEIRYDGKSGDGLTRAHLAESWVWSLGSATEGTTAPLVYASKYIVSITGEATETEACIPNLAEQAHVTHWRTQLAAWGCEVSDNYLVGSVDGHRIVMYPLDHLPPHLHVLTNEREPKVYRFRVDQFENLNGAPRSIASVIEAWMRENGLQLMESWYRCSLGQHPLKVAPNS